MIVTPHVQDMDIISIHLWILTMVISWSAGKGCPAFWTRVEDRCYRVVSSLGIDSLGFPTVYHARQTCRQYGGDLAYIPDVHTQHEALALLRAISLDSLPRKIYIGLTDIRANDKFEWLNGRVPTYSIWGPGEPNDSHLGHEACVIIKSPGRTWDTGDLEWHDYPCCHQAYITHALCSTDLHGSSIHSKVSTLGINGSHEDILETECNIVDECDSNPCQNNATCVDSVMTYICVCPTGYQGVHCEEEILCPLPGTGHATVGTIYDGHLEWYPMDKTITITCDNGYSFPETNNPVIKHYNCTQYGWQLIQTEYLRCQPIPVWYTIIPNSTLRHLGSLVNYTCDDNDDEMEFEDGEPFKLTECNESYVWEPPFEDCQKVKRKLKFHQYRKPAEATGAVVLGTFGLIFLVTELVLFVLMDINVFVNQFALAYTNIKSWLKHRTQKSDFQSVPTQL